MGYISPPCMYYLTMDDAMDVWGQKINPEDIDIV